ncbi:MAG: exopolysaccharide biosynthesis polyprenyl glycosylphosphotransferase [Bacteroidales bacterium]|nr:exopolysaccharide biosynthesis polyprenyl glycosylphosphotransferase [Bacteroidales bacterium]
MKTRYSSYLRPATFFLDISVLNLWIYLFIILPDSVHGIQIFNFLLMMNIGWFLSANILGIYNIFRLTKFTRIVKDLIKQMLVFSFMTFSFFTIYRISLSENIIRYIFEMLFFLGASLVAMRTFSYFFIKRYRLMGGNYRNVIIAGVADNSYKLSEFFKNKREYGYRFHGYFSNEKSNELPIAGSIADIPAFAEKINLHQIYCNAGVLKTEEINHLIHFAENNLIEIKFIPDPKIDYGQNLVLQYYDYIPVFALREIPFQTDIKWIKRGFDILFSSFVIVFILSWLIPVLGLFIRLESKGPIIFKQKRNGLNNQEFQVYKFRSMFVNGNHDKTQTSINDERLTKIGKFIRRTSIDELPQFINVFLGSMSVVGPRPHPIFLTEQYAKIIDKYMVRHFVKPGVTGLAQIKGFRGEIQDNEQMRNRIRLDKFYIENWTLFLDIEIVIKTMLNSFKNQHNGY